MVSSKGFATKKTVENSNAGSRAQLKSYMNTGITPITNSRYSVYLVLLLMASLLAFSVSIFEIVSMPTGKSGWSVPITYVSLLWFLSYFILTFYHYKSYYLYTSAIIICLMIFHFGIIYQLAFGANLRGWGSGIDSKWQELAGWYCVLSLSCIGLGLSFYPFFSSRKYIIKKDKKRIKKEVKEVLYWSGMGLFVASIIFFIMTLASYGNIFNYARHEIFRATVDSRGFGLFTMCFPSSALLLFFGAQKKHEKTFAICVASIAFLVFILSGYRSRALFAAFVGVITWVKVGNRIPLLLSIGIVVSVLFIISFSGKLRTMGSYDQIDKEEILESAEKTSIEDVVKLGRTIGIVGNTLKFVPRQEDYRYGRSYLRALEGAIPNIGLSMDTSRGRGMIKGKSGKEALYDLAPSDWMTYRILRAQYDLGQGVGFSGVAEPYLNFGLFGVIIYFFIVGIFMGVLDSKTIIYNQNLFIVATVFLSFFLYTVRNDFSTFVKPSSFVSIILFIWWTCSYLFFKKRFSIRK